MAYHRSRHGPAGGASPGRARHRPGRAEHRPERARHRPERAKRRRRRLFPLLGLIAASVTGGLVAAERSDAHARTPPDPAVRVSPPAHPLSRTATGVFADPAVERYLAQQSADVTAAVYDIPAGTTSLYRPGVTEDTASIVKVDILACRLAQAQAAGTPLDATQQALAEAMIEHSDNDAATALWDDDGSAAGVTQFDHEVGLTGTVPGANGYWGLTTTTALDQVRLLRDLVFPNAVLSTASRDYELNLMDNDEADQQWGVSAGPPAGTSVALKDGWLPQNGQTDWQVNSIGWVDDDGRNYVIAVLTSGSATEAAGIDAIQGLSSLVWSALAPT